MAASKERERLLQEQIEGMNRRFFGRSSEKHMVQSEGQLDFFNEVELEADKQQEEEFPYEADPELVPGKEEQKPFFVKLYSYYHNNAVEKDHSLVCTRKKCDLKKKQPVFKTASEVLCKECAIQYVIPR